ncbi:MAG TPA: tryptophan synthase subunit alpha, partial [Anaeromyxobacteraceae bacterium]|nr:tryptophan synthase subunit alpha [Anaeromyxobacteraceae bacterium]
EDRLASVFAAARARGEAALVVYLMAGDPDLATSRAAALACAEAGADVIEIGMPFSDPIADGPTIQRAAERALAHGTTVADALAVAAHVRARSGAGLALMGYVNPVLSHGLPRFFGDAAGAGVDAVILPDVPPDEAGEVKGHADAAGVRTVFLLAPTSTPARREAAVRAASGFLYFVSVTGVTGARRELSPDLAAQVEAVRAVSPVPVVVGFGVSTPEQAHAVAGLADGVVVGSALVARLAEPGSRAQRVERVRRFVRALKRAMKR